MNGSTAIPLYDYSVDGTVTLDPYAPSMSQWVHQGTNVINGDSQGKGAVVDLATTLPATTPYFDGSKMVGPDGTTSTPYTYTGNRDAIVYETDIRDFTVDPALGLTHPFGTYGALIDMLPHIKKLGVTHIQLLSPLENFYYDQTKIGTRETGIVNTGANYNWGYDPQNYFTPTGMYSAAPNNPASRVQELITLINAIHNAGMGVILDVVYNHTANNTILGNAVNNYYYRATSYNGAGSYDVKTEATMTRKLIVDSIAQWVNVYHVDGFRFDLMGILDDQTIKDAYSVAKSYNPKVIFLGEGWNGMYGGASTDYQGNALAGSNQNNASVFNGLNVGMFSDSFRQIFKNGYPNDGAKAFITGAAQNYNYLIKDISGNPNDGGGNSVWDTASGGTFSTNNVVNYLSAHDNLCLYDVVACADGLGTSTTDYNTALQRMEIGYTALMTSQGLAFMQAGDEMFRTKETGIVGTNYTTITSGSGRIFNDNSYNASDAVNQILFSSTESYPVAKVAVSPYSGDPVAGGFTNYNTSTVGYKLYKYVQGLIQIRKSSDAFRLPDADISTNITGVPSDQGTGTSVLSFGYSAKSSDGAHTFYVFLNADTVSHSFTTTNLTTGTVLADGVSAGLPGTAATSYSSVTNGVTVGASSVTLAGLTACIIEM
jgi:pullulanase/glycogen debranching enzyme